MTPTQYFRIVLEILERAPCRVLVFGAGRDTELYVCANHGGHTLVIEDNRDWAAQATRIGCAVSQVEYTTRLGRGLIDPCVPPKGLPEWVMNEPWDVILVDGPKGFSNDCPGRQQSIYVASIVAGPGSVVFVHDWERPAEQTFCGKYLKPVDEQIVDKRILAVFSYPKNATNTMPSAPEAHRQCDM